ncbi:hypothetical protein SLE2022_386870 [Rubroshorea leprosula]
MASHQEADSNAIQTMDGSYLLTPKAFDIVWGNESKYWRIPSDTWAGIPAELLQVWWFELSGSVPVIPGKKYRISFKLGFNPNSVGWKAHPTFLMAKIGKSGQYVWKSLKEVERMPRGPIDLPGHCNPCEIEVPPSALDTTLYFGIYEIWSGREKRGLLVYSASVKEVKTDD